MWMKHTNLSWEIQIKSLSDCWLLLLCCRCGAERRLQSFKSCLVFIRVFNSADVFLAVLEQIFYLFVGRSKSRLELMELRVKLIFSVGVEFIYSMKSSVIWFLCRVVCEESTYRLCCKIFCSLCYQPHTLFQKYLILWESDPQKCELWLWPKL